MFQSVLLCGRGVRYFPPNLSNFLNLLLYSFFINHNKIFKLGSCCFFMGLLKKLVPPLLVGSMTLSLLPVANSEEFKENSEMNVGEILSVVEKIRETDPIYVISGKNEGKRGLYSAWDLTGDGFYNLIIFNEFYPGTISEIGDFIKGKLKYYPYTIFINIKDPEEYNTERGDIFLRRSMNGRYEKGKYVGSEKEI